MSDVLITCTAWTNSVSMTPDLITHATGVSSPYHGRIRAGGIYRNNSLLCGLVVADHPIFAKTLSLPQTQPKFLEMTQTIYRPGIYPILVQYYFSDRTMDNPLTMEYMKINFLGDLLDYYKMLDLSQ